MRIIGGKWKGLILRPPKDLPVRPTTDRAKESLFNILENRINFTGIYVLDLFSGTGSIALEFCSRGAEGVLAIDSSPSCVQFIREMKNKHEIRPLEIRKADVFAFLSKSKPEFDLIFSDAPYAHPKVQLLPSLAIKALKPNGILIIEHDHFLSLRGCEKFTEERIYGQSVFSFFHA